MLEIKKLLDLLNNGYPFAYNRFSDGEYYIINNDFLEIGKDIVKVGNLNVKNSYSSFDFKLFDPNKHSDSRNRLIEAFIHNQNSYFKGLMCKCCTSRKNYNNQFKLLKMFGGSVDSNLVSANLFVNGNFDFFRDIFLPELFKKKLVIICHESADLTNISHVKSFRLTYNSFVRELFLIDDIKDWINQEKIENHVFIVSGSSWAKIAIFELFKFFPKNTYLDIGTSMNFDFGMPTNRGYLNEYYSDAEISDLNRLCTI